MPEETTKPLYRTGEIRTLKAGPIIFHHKHLLDGVVRDTSWCEICRKGLAGMVETTQESLPEFGLFEGGGDDEKGPDPLPLDNGRPWKAKG